MKELLEKQQALKDDLADIFERILRRSNRLVYFKDGTTMPRKTLGKVLTDIRTEINKIGNEIALINYQSEVNQREQRAQEAEWIRDNPEEYIPTPEEIEMAQLENNPEEDYYDSEQEQIDYENDPAYQEMLENSRAYHEDMIYTEKDLNELKDKLKKIEKTLEPVKIPELEFLVKPNVMNRRFICGYSESYDKSAGKDERDWKLVQKFVMVFWNYFKDCSNGHGDLEKYYNDHFDSHFRATAGGFYMSNGHNNCSDPDLFYLFGRSDTFGHFSEHLEEITEYARENKFRVILGQTAFESGEKSNALLSMPRAYSA